MKLTTYVIVMGTILLGIGVLLSGYHAAFAAMDSSSGTSTPALLPMQPACMVLDRDLHYGSTDASTNGQVTTLQQFLSRTTYLDSSALGTGTFGPLTRASVIQFQIEHGVSATGYVGSLTRAAIANSQGKDCATPVVANAALYSITPSKAAVGDTMKINGSGFSSSNTILFDGMVVARDVPIESSAAYACSTNAPCHPGIHQTLSFTVPSSASPNCLRTMMCPMYVRLLTAGKYQVSVLPTESVSSSNSLPITLVKATRSK